MQGIRFPVFREAILCSSTFGVLYWSPGVQANPTSSFSPIPEGQAGASHPVGQPPLRRSSRKRVPRQILDL